MNSQFTEEQIKPASDAITAIYGPGPDSDGMWRDAAEASLCSLVQPLRREQDRQSLQNLVQKLENIAESSMETSITAL